MVVHLPIGMLVAAVIIDFVALVLRRVTWLLPTAVLMYVLGAVATLAAYLTGQRAADSVDVPTEALGTIASHEDWAFYTLLFFGAYALIRLGAYIANKTPGLALSLVLWLGGLAGLGLLSQASDRGGKLVYAHGVGVAAVSDMTDELETLRAETRAAQAEPVEEPNGGWSWHVTDGAAEALAHHFTWLIGSPDAVEATVITDTDTEALEISLSDEVVFVVFGDAFADVAVQARIHADDFEGTVSLVHNVVDATSYHYWTMDSTRFLQGRVVDGTDEVLDEETHHTEGWISLRATGASGHFYGYANDESLAHGHSTTPDPGRTGLRLEGTGTVRLAQFVTQPTN